MCVYIYIYMYMYICWMVLILKYILKQMECNWRTGVALRAEINKENWFINKNK